MIWIEQANCTTEKMLNDEDMCGLLLDLLCARGDPYCAAVNCGKSPGQLSCYEEVADTNWNFTKYRCGRPVREFHIRVLLLGLRVDPDCKISSAAETCASVTMYT